MAKPALGRGLGALLGGSPIAKPGGSPPAATNSSTSNDSVISAAPIPAAAPDNRDRVRRVAHSLIQPCRFQPRKHFEPEALKELADSIREQGIVQPLVVREQNGHLELIAGERRWRAAQLAGLAEVPVIVRQADDRAVLELALIENLQRENLNPIEEAQGYAQLLEQFSMTQEQVAVKVGKSRAAVANSLRLLKLAPSVQNWVREGRLSVGHAKVILALIGEKEQKTAAERVVNHGLNVRQTEELVQAIHARLSSPVTSAKVSALAGPARDAHVADLENRLREKFGTKVALKYAQGKGALEISFFSDAEFERILDLLGVRD
jgi:ParB family transcriptional regulator, chromosome partitioning protein